MRVEISKVMAARPNLVPKYFRYFLSIVVEFMQ